MNVGLSFATFVVGAIVSLVTSWVLVTRLERVGERFGLSEALLGLVAALAADAPEITASVTALLHHQRTIGAGVVIGSNVFNLAALLGLGAVVAGGIALHRKVVLLGGTVAVFMAAVCVVTVAGAVPLAVGLVLVLAVLVGYAVILGAHRRVLSALPLPPSWTAWLTTAIVEEEAELEEAIRPQRGNNTDVVVSLFALVVVVVASAAMEQGASTLGRHYGVAEIVVGGLVLAAVTSLPNAVAAVFLASKGRGAAALSTALNSNTINVAAGLLIPAAFIGLAKPSGSGLLVAGWYAGLTVLTLVLAYLGRGLRRWSGWLIIAAYVVFVAVVLVIA
jgi:cation:H+ antiporter